VNNCRIKILLFCLTTCLNILLFADNVDYTYNIDMDTSLCKAQTFSTTVTGVPVLLYGTVLNLQLEGGKKITVIDFNLTNSSNTTSFTLIIDSIYVRTYENTQLGYDLYSRSDFIHVLAVNVDQKESYFFRSTLQYPHTENWGSTFRVHLRIFGSSE